jgi:molybdopterin/thiamine biosynthesis adenylyltransferase
MLQLALARPPACLQEKTLDFYEQFHVIVLGLDSLEARRYMNSVACSFLGLFFQSRVVLLAYVRAGLVL